MHFLYEIIPVLLFFLAFKWYGIYVATKVGMIASAIQVIFSRLYFKKWDRAQIITLIAFLLFGGLTLYFHNAMFIKWKPTIVFWIFALIILGSHFFMKKSMMHHLMEKAFQGKYHVPDFVWHKLNYAWSVFFVSLGLINLFIAYHYSDAVWVNFKFYGITSAILVASILQSVYLTRHLVEKKES